MEPRPTYNLQLITPFTAQVVGATGSGKMEFVYNLLRHSNDIVDQKFDKYIYCYGEYQKKFEEFPFVEFVHSFDPYVCSLECTGGKSCLLILDDVLDTIDSTSIVNLYQKFSHHRLLSPVILLNNLYHKGLKGLRDVSLNSQYLVYMKSPRDKVNLRTLQCQMFPGQAKYFYEAYSDATKEPYSYLFLDAKPLTPDHLRVRTGIFPFEQMCAYVPIK